MKKDKSFLDAAFEVIEKNGADMPFKDIYDKVAEELEMSEEEKLSNLGTFYTNLTLDGRFVLLTDNSWDLRSRHTFEKYHIDTRDVYSIVNDDSNAEQEDKEEESEFESSINGPQSVSDFNDTDLGDEGNDSFEENEYGDR